MAFQVGPFQTNFQQVGSAPPATVTPSVGGGRRRRHPEVIRWEEPEKAPDLSEFTEPVRKAIHRTLEKAPPDDAAAIRVLRNELHRLRVRYRPEYAKALLQFPNPIEIERKRQDDEDDDLTVLLLLH